MPYKLCYAAIVMYEWSYIAAATIMIGYSCLEYPFSNLDGTWNLEGRAWYIDLLGHIIHVAPCGVALWEYSISSIRLEVHRLPLYICLLIFYTLVNIGEGEIRGTQWYSSLEWINRPKMSTIICFFFISLFSLMAIFLKFISDHFHGPR